MYLSYYQLERKPFQITADPNFLWLGDKHKEALAVLRYGLMDNKGFLLLTGDVGTGKTTLINALVNTLGDEVIVATLLDPGIETNDFFSYIGKAFTLTQNFSSKGEFVRSFSDFLNQTHDAGKKVLLIIDESQRLSQELLEEIRLLSNIEKHATKLINIFFVGQIEFNSIILEPKNSALRQRISVNYNLKPLSAKETEKYVHHRLKVAGAAKPLFNAAAIREIYRFSNGYPRLINIICDRALVTGFLGESKKIGPKIVQECARELKLQNQKSRSKRNPHQETSSPPEVRPKSVLASRSPFIEKVLYTILALLITTWVAIAVYYYFPQYFQGSQTTQSLGPVNLADKNDRIEPGEKRVVPEKPASMNTTLEQPPVAVSENQMDVNAISEAGEDDLEPLQMPDQHVVIRIDFGDNNELDANGIGTLDNLSVVMHNHPRQKISIKGYSESRGSYRYNKKMSEFTANIVKGYLVGKGVSPRRIETMGMWVIHSDSNVPATDTLKNAQWVEIQFKDR